MKRVLSPLLALLALVLCVNLGIPSTEGKGGSKIKFYGTYKSTETGGTEQPIDNILLDGKTDHIEFYGKPADKDTHPATKTTFLSLDDILRIKPAKTPPKDAIVSYKGRDYIEVIVTLKPKYSGAQPTEKSFLVESTRKLFCDLVTVAGNLEQQILFNVLVELTILGFRHREQSSGEKESVKAHSAAETVLCSQAKDNLKQLKEKEGPSSKLIKPVEDLVNYFCKKP